MNAWTLALAGALLLHVPAGDPSVCACAAARGAGGWCAQHRVGYLGGVKIASASLYEVMDPHGHEVDPTTFPCPACQAAIAADGFCPEHRVGFVSGKAYFSLLTHHLAKGEVRDPARTACRACRRNARKHGWCESCRLGRIGSIALHDRAEFDAAVQAIAVLRSAVEASSRCEGCAAAMVTDTACPWCRIQYRNGKEVARR